jgi:hypothetical protein
VLSYFAWPCNELLLFLCFWDAILGGQGCGCGHGWNGIEYPLRLFLYCIMRKCLLACGSHICIQLCDQPMIEHS